MQRRGRGVIAGNLQPNSVPPAFMNYVCKRCNKSGHYIQFCPTNNDPEYDLPSNKRLGIISGDSAMTVERVRLLYS